MRVADNISRGTVECEWVNPSKTADLLDMGCLDLNPFTLRAAKTGLTILKIFYLQSHFLENI